MVDVYSKESQQIFDAGWLTQPLFLTWDDWDLGADEGRGSWHVGAPVFFFPPEDEAKRFYSLTALGISACRSSRVGLISPNDKGMSFFVYRYLRQKKIIHLIPTSSGQVGSVQLEDRFGKVVPHGQEHAVVVLRVPSLTQRLFQSFSTPDIPDKLSRGDLRVAIKTWLASNLSNAEQEVGAVKTELRKKVATILREACEAFKLKDSKGRAAVRDALIATVLFHSFGYNSLKETFFIPSLGFRLPDRSGEEECSGGLYFWCSSETRCDPQALQAYDTYRGLRTSVIDWEKKGREEALKAARKSAMAAIMSRNFSHNVGSHSLANPRLRESVGITRLNGALNNAQVAEIRSIIEQRLETFHSYAQGRLDFLARAISESGNRPEPLFFLNDVLEGGFFRQGVLLDTLIEDAGFAAHMIEFHLSIQRADKSGFGSAIYTWGGRTGSNKNSDEPVRHQFVREPGDDIEDVVVGIPGGMIGSHALYAFLENIMRNAVKYGSELHGGKHVGKLHLYLRLERCKALNGEKAEDAWVFSIWDNVSSDTGGGVAKQIRIHINESLIDEAGETRTQGHGIQEMKLCAELLSGGVRGLRFPGDRGYRPGNNGCTHCPEVCEASKEYAAFRGDATAINDLQPLRCYSVPHLFMDSALLDKQRAEQLQWLTYNLIIPIPVLLGVVSPKHAVAASGAKLPPHIRYFESVQGLAENGAHIGVLLDDENDSSWSAKALKDAAQFHPALPFRLMVVTGKEDDDSNAWRQELDGQFKKPDSQPFRYPEHIPSRRVRICGGKRGNTLLLLLSEPNADSENRFLGAGGTEQQRWDAIVLRTYDAWLLAYKSHREGIRAQFRAVFSGSKTATWNLCVGFEHGGDAVADRWDARLKEFTTESQTCVAIHIVSKKGKDDKIPARKFSPNSNLPTDTSKLSDAFENEARASFDKKTFLIFDNHGECFGFKAWEQPFGKASRFAQKIGLKDGLSLFQSLENPPSSPFAFALFVYEVVEGALTKVAILDERVAQATLNQEGSVVSGLAEKRHTLNVAGLFPLYSFTGRNAKNVRLSLRLDEALETTRKVIASSIDDEKWNLLWSGTSCEGIHVEEKQVWLSSLIREGKILAAVDAQQLRDVDVLIAHEGVADRLHSEGVWNREDTASLFACVPFVVRTSGRGRESRRLRNCLPFLEFTELSENTYGGLNKVSLVKALLGSSGDFSEFAKGPSPL